MIPGGPILRAAPPGRRVLARLIDSVGYLVLLAAAAVVMVQVLRDAFGSVGIGYASPRSDDPALAVLWIYPILGGVWLLIVAYEALTIGLTGATVGHRLMGVRFVSLRDGGRPGLGRGLGRAALIGGAFVVSGLLALLLLFSIFFDTGSGRYQGWVDKLTGLQAVDARVSRD